MNEIVLFSLYPVASNNKFFHKNPLTIYRMPYDSANKTKKIGVTVFHYSHYRHGFRRYVFHFIQCHEWIYVLNGGALIIYYWNKKEKQHREWNWKCGVCLHDTKQHPIQIRSDNCRVKQQPQQQQHVKLVPVASTIWKNNTVRFVFI